MKTKMIRPSGVCPRGFTLVELLVTVAILAVLAGVALSLGNRAVVTARLSTSVSKVRDLGTLVLSHAQEHGDRLPVWQDGEDYWWKQIAADAESDPEPLFKSPAHNEFDRDRLDATISYGWNAVVVGRSVNADDFGDTGQRRVSEFARPSRILVLVDGSRENGYGIVEPGGALPDPERYGGRVAALMLDGTGVILNAGADFKADSKWFNHPSTLSAAR